MHVRGQIREAVRTILTAISGLSDRTFFDSDEVPEDIETPCAVVTLGGEDITHETLFASNGAVLLRNSQLNIDLIYRARRDALLAAEELAASIETAIASSSLGTLLTSWFLQSITVERDAEGAQPTVQMRLQWLVSYATNERDPTVAIP